MKCLHVAILEDGRWSGRWKESARLCLVEELAEEPENIRTRAYRQLHRGLFFLARTLQIAACSITLASGRLIQSDNFEVRLLSPLVHSVRSIIFNLVEVASKALPLDVVFTCLIFPNTANHPGKLDRLKCGIPSTTHIENKDASHAPLGHHRYNQVLPTFRELASRF